MDGLIPISLFSLILTLVIQLPRLTYDVIVVFLLASRSKSKKGTQNLHSTSALRNISTGTVKI